MVGRQYSGSRFTWHKGCRYSSAAGTAVQQWLHSADIAAFCRHCSYICCCCDQISSSIHQVYTSLHVQAVSQVYIQIQTRCSAMFTCPCAGADTKGRPALYSLPRQHSSTTCHQCIPPRAMSQWRLCCCAWQPPSAQQVRTLAQLHGTQLNVVSTKIQAIFMFAQLVCYCVCHHQLQVSCQYTVPSPKHAIFQELSISLLHRHLAATIQQLRLATVAKLYTDCFCTHRQFARGCIRRCQLHD